MNKKELLKIAYTVKASNAAMNEVIKYFKLGRHQVRTGRTWHSIGTISLPAKNGSIELYFKSYGHHPSRFEAAIEYVPKGPGFMPIASGLHDTLKIIEVMEHGIKNGEIDEWRTN